MMRNYEQTPWSRPGLKCLLLIVFFTIAFYGCAASLPRSPGKNAATYKASVDLRYHGFQRTYLVHLPPGYDAGRPLPMVVVIHGAFGNSRRVEKYSGFSELADKKRFIVLYPNGIGVLGNFQHWNAGHCCGKAAENGIDDIGFIETVIEDACRRLAVDRKRIYMVGFSNGGMLTYSFAAEKGDILAAIALLAASAGGGPDSDHPKWTPPEPVTALPVIAIHGMADDLVPFDGSLDPEKKCKQKYWSVMRSLDFWGARNGCTETPAQHDERHDKVHVRAWKNCMDNKGVVLYTLEGWPHLWPTRFYTDRLPPQDPLYHFDATSIIWDFFDASTR